MSKLPWIKHYHVTFTLPGKLRRLAKKNKGVFYDAMFKAAGWALKEWFWKKYKVVAGIIMVIQTSGGALKYHPHIHCIVTGGGLREGEWFEIEGDYLVNEMFIGNKFRVKLNDLLIKAYDSGEIKFPEDLSHLLSRKEFMILIDQTYEKRCVASVEKPLKDPEEIVRYVGRYTKRACLSEYKIKGFEDGYITYEYKEYYRDKKGRNRSRDREITLHYKEFFDRLFQHVPEPGFRCVRYYGIYARMGELPPKPAPEVKPKPEKLSWRELQIEKTGEDPLICPVCGSELKFKKTYFPQEGEYPLILPIEEVAYAETG